MYGIRFHLASDREGTKINLAVSHMGVLVFQVRWRGWTGNLCLFLLTCLGSKSIILTSGAYDDFKI